MMLKECQRYHLLVPPRPLQAHLVKEREGEKKNRVEAFKLCLPVVLLRHTAIQENRSVGLKAIKNQSTYSHGKMKVNPLSVVGFYVSGRNQDDPGFTRISTS